MQTFVRPISQALQLVALTLFMAGCAAPSGTQPRPGSGIAEYRQIAREAERAVAGTVASLEALARPHPESSSPPPGLDRFDRSLHRLEVTSVKTRARAEAIMARGQAYFDEWKEQLAGTTNQATARVEAERYARLHEQFNRIRAQSGEVRAEFRPFMAKLREFRAGLDKADSSLATEGSQKNLQTLTSDGRRVLQALASVLRALDEAEAELRASLASQR